VKGKGGERGREEGKKCHPHPLEKVSKITQLPRKCGIQ